MQTLDAMQNERPKVLEMKKKHLRVDENIIADLEWMRIHAEKERITLYKSIAKQSAILYYTVLKRFSEETIILERQKAAEKNNIGFIDP